MQAKALGELGSDQKTLANPDLKPSNNSGAEQPPLPETVASNKKKNKPIYALNARQIETLRKNRLEGKYKNANINKPLLAVETSSPSSLLVDKVRTSNDDDTKLEETSELTEKPNTTKVSETSETNELSITSDHRNEELAKSIESEDKVNKAEDRENDGHELQRFEPKNIPIVSQPLECILVDYLIAKDSNVIRNELLECPICLQLINNAMETSCGHCFCSFCINKSLEVGMDCPVCKSDPSPIHVSFTVRRMISEIKLDRSRLEQKAAFYRPHQPSSHTDDLLPESLSENSDKTPVQNVDQNSEPIISTEELRNQGNENFQRLQYAQAIELYSRALEESSGGEPRIENSTIYSNRSLCYIKLRQYALGLNDAKKAISLNSTNIKAHIRASICCRHLYRTEQAFEFLRQSERLDTKSNFIYDIKDQRDLLRDTQPSAPKKTNQKDSNRSENDTTNNQARLSNSVNIDETLSGQNRPANEIVNQYNIDENNGLYLSNNLNSSNLKVGNDQSSSSQTLDRQNQIRSKEIEEQYKDLEKLRAKPKNLPARQSSATQASGHTTYQSPEEWVKQRERQQQEEKKRILQERELELVRQKQLKEKKEYQKRQQQQQSSLWNYMPWFTSSPKDLSNELESEEIESETYMPTTSHSLDSRQHIREKHAYQSPPYYTDYNYNYYNNYSDSNNSSNKTRYGSSYNSYTNDKSNELHSQYSNINNNAHSAYCSHNLSHVYPAQSHSSSKKERSKKKQTSDTRDEKARSSHTHHGQNRAYGFPHVVYYRQ